MPVARILPHIPYTPPHSGTAPSGSHLGIIFPRSEVFSFPPLPVAMTPSINVTLSVQWFPNLRGLHERMIRSSGEKDLNTPRWLGASLVLSTLTAWY